MAENRCERALPWLWRSCLRPARQKQNIFPTGYSNSASKLSRSLAPPPFFLRQTEIVSFHIISIQPPRCSYKCKHSQWNGGCTRHYFKQLGSFQNDSASSLRHFKYRKSHCLRHSFTNSPVGTTLFSLKLLLHPLISKADIWKTKRNSAWSTKRLQAASAI